MRFLSDIASRSFKKTWVPLLEYTARLHERSIHRAIPPFLHDWAEIGPGYRCSAGLAFGHWDLIHQLFDTAPADPDHARKQIQNYLAFQEADGFLPGTVYVDMENASVLPTRVASHPPVWPVFVEEFCAQTGSSQLIGETYENLCRQIAWFERHRAADPEGFYYLDILTRLWESGVDEGLRFDEVLPGPYACVDASSHVYTLYEIATRWAEVIGVPSEAWRGKAERLRRWIAGNLFHERTALFHDIFSVKTDSPPLTLEGMWPMVTGAAEPGQAQRIIDENLLNPQRFLTRHPSSMVGVEELGFELKMWRGPAWNSQTYWAARGCVRYGRADAARLLLERALDETARVFSETGTIWEFYHPHGGSPLDLQRKPGSPRNTPCRDYLGHNPLLAMARLWVLSSGLEPGR